MKFTIVDVYEANPNVDRKRVKTLMNVFSKKLINSREDTTVYMITESGKGMFLPAHKYDLDEAVDYIKNKYATYRGGWQYEDLRKLYLAMLENVREYLSKEVA